MHLGRRYLAIDRHLDTFSYLICFFYSQFSVGLFLMSLNAGMHLQSRERKDLTVESGGLFRASSLSRSLMSFHVWLLVAKEMSLRRRSHDFLLTVLLCFFDPSVYLFWTGFQLAQ
jgi:hypothetical protein